MEYESDDEGLDKIYQLTYLKNLADDAIDVGIRTEQTAKMLNYILKDMHKMFGEIGSKDLSALDEDQETEIEEAHGTYTFGKKMIKEFYDSINSDTVELYGAIDAGAVPVPTVKIPDSKITIETAPISKADLKWVRTDCFPVSPIRAPQNIYRLDAPFAETNCAAPGGKVLKPVGDAYDKICNPINIPFIGNLNNTTRLALYGAKGFRNPVQTIRGNS